MEITSGYIRQDKAEELKAELAKLSRKAIKLGLEPITIDVDWKDTQTKEFDDFTMGGKVPYKMVYHLVKVSVSGKTPKLPDWNFIGLIEHRSVKGPKLVEIEGRIPDAFKDTTNLVACDHCGVKRYRTQTFIVQNEKTKEYKRVGRSCLKDFVGHKSARQLVWWAAFMPSLAALLNMMNSGNCCGLKAAWKLDDVLSVAAAVIDQRGWVSSSAAYYDKTGKLSSTRNAVYDVVRGLDSVEVLPEHRETAEKAIAWAKDFTVENTTSEYLSNLGNVARQIYIPFSFFGVAVSMIPAYRKDFEKNEASRILSQHIGEVGKKVTRKVQIFRQNSYDGAYGTVNFLMFKDEGGNVFVWKTGTSNGYDFGADTLPVITNPDQVPWYELTGTVKEHTSFNKIPQTVLTRCKGKKI